MGMSFTGDGMRERTGGGGCVVSSKKIYIYLF